MPFSSNYLSCAGYELHYTEWGAQHGRTDRRGGLTGATPLVIGACSALT